jgi:hypothetical protein
MAFGYLKSVLTEVKTLHAHFVGRTLLGETFINLDYWRKGGSGTVVTIRRKLSRDYALELSEEKVSYKKLEGK